jgi:phosphate transport system substrate-binding protein
MRAWIGEYEKAHPEVSIKPYASIGSGAGNKRFLGVEDEPVDFAVSEAPPSAEELAAVPGGGIVVPVTAGSIVIAYNRTLTGLPNGIRLSRDVYFDIFLGDIVYWDDERIRGIPGNEGISFPHTPIIVVTRADKSGTTYAFTSHLWAASPKWREKFGEESRGKAKFIDWPRSGGDGRGNEDQAGAIKRTEGGLGYLQYGIAKHIELGMAVLENAAGNYIEPTAESFLLTLAESEMPADFRLSIPDPQGLNSYPMVTLAWALVPRELAPSGRNPQAIDFLKWCLKEGQGHADELGYAELPEELCQQFISALDAID